MKTMLRHVSAGDDRYDALMFWCPGCETSPGHGGLHMLPVTGDGSKRPVWSWDGNLEAPTLSPSILTHFGLTPPFRCHSYLRAGVFEFLTDCTHALRGQHVPMPDLPDWVTRNA